MKLSKLIKILRKAKKDYGDVPVKVLDEYGCDWQPVVEVIKLHLHTVSFGCPDRKSPVAGVALSRQAGYALDLVISDARTT